MLQNIREKLTGWVALAVLGAIGLSFVFVGGANFATIGQSYAAKVDGVDIAIGQFELAYRDQLQQNPQLAALPEEYRLQLRSNILEQMIQQRVVDNYLVEAGLQVSTQELTEFVHQIPEFQVDGKFDQETYVEVLQLNNRTVSEFEQAQMLSLRRDQLQRAIRGSSVVPPSSYRRFLNLAFESRVITTATMSAESVAAEINVTDEMISAYYDDNPALFQIPESADIEYIEITRQSVAADVAVTEEQLRDYYEQEKDRLRQDEQRQARHILILFDDDEAGAENIATEILTRARSGESFAELARQYSKDGGTASNGGDLGALTETQLPDALGEAVFSMQEGTFRGPIKGDFGFHIVRLDKILESGPLPFEQVRASLLVELQEREAEGRFLGLERELSDALFDAPDIRALASTVAAEVKTLTGFSRNGGEPFAGNQIAVDAVFDATVLSGAQMSDIVELDADRTAVFSVVQHNPATRQPLSEVREQVETALISSTSEELMAGRAQQMLDALAAGEEFAVAAAAASAEVQPPSLMTRNDENADQFMMAAVFTALKPTQDKPTTGSTRNGTGGYTVYSVDAVIPGRPEQIPLADRDSGKLQLTDQYGVGDFVAFVQSLRADAEVIINEDALAAQDLFQ
ncbi:MAG: SurA N-terminal domain-containing protein [Gammaproteobacteria bacterium]|nr:SurA N-terminal domain-containing protein [Gammaproteobacteria bacterium]